MKQQVLKALANPSQIFHVPYFLAIINFCVQFIVFIIIFVVALLVFKKDIQPLWFLLSVIIVHLSMAFFSKKDPQIGQIISAKLKMLKHKIPGKLPA
ncbi:MAG: VirB3 family type IV secretion system protein [Alphaproteobacteria bacterium]